MGERLKPNFTPVPNVLLDEVMRDLNEGEFKTLMAICRYTYGWGKQSDQISLNQIAEITGMNRSNVARARKRLGSLVQVTPGTATTASTYRLNIEISDAELKAASAKGSDPSATRGSDRDATSDPSATSVKGSDPSATIQRKPKKEEYTEPDDSEKPTPDSSSTKKRRKTPEPDPAKVEAFNRWYAIYPRRVAQESAFGEWCCLNPDAVLSDTIMAATARYANSVQGKEAEFIPYPRTWLHQRRWKDELDSRFSSNGNGHAKPPLKDLGNGMVEVEGVKMDRKTYELRYGTET